MREPTREQWAWAAGLFEGEGTILTPTVYSVRLALRMTDEDIVRRFAKICGGTVTGPYVYDEIRKPFWVWSSSGTGHAARVLKRFLPWLGLRRTERLQATGVLDQLVLF